MENVKKFLEIDHNNSYCDKFDYGWDWNYGDGNGSGGGNNSGYGYGDGDTYNTTDGGNNGKGNGKDKGNGSGFGAGYGYGYGVGSGAGYGRSYGYDDGSGFGGGSDYEGVTSFNDQTVYMIDDIPTIITSAKNNLARGFILNDDLTTTPCYIAKCGYLFAHGETLKKAREALQDKLFDNLSEEKRIDAFLAEFNTTDKYPAEMFYKWHHTLTLSCEAGRQSFIRNHGIDLNNDSFTVREFCELCKNDYGGNIIKKILNKI